MLYRKCIRKYFAIRNGFSKAKGTLGLASTDGWMTGEVFVSVVRQFIKHNRSTKDKPTIYDNQESHLTIET